MSILAMQFFMLFFSFPSWSAEESLHLISVNGVAETSIDPNFVNLQVESWGRGKSAKAAQLLQAAQFEYIKSILTHYKIKDEDFRTENFSVYPEIVYDTKLQRNKVTEFRASQSVSILLRKVDEAGDLIDGLAKGPAGSQTSGISVHNISWDSDKKVKAEDLVIDEAVRSARNKAELLAKAAGVKIKAVHRLSHNSYTPQPLAGRAMMSLLEKSSNGAAEPATDLSHGKIKIRVEVQMEFEI